MEPGTTGGIIIAAGKTGEMEEFHPLLQLGNISVVKRIVLTFQQAGVNPIVIITGKQANEVEHHLSTFHVIFLRNERFKDSHIIDSAKIGLRFLKNKCSRVVISKVNTPLFTTETLLSMLNCPGNIVTPAYHQITGHPICLDSEAANQILDYQGAEGIRGFLKKTALVWHHMDTEDEGVIFHADELKNHSYLLENHNRQIIHPYIRLSIEKETAFFDSRTRLLLMLIQETHSVRSSCSQMALSCSKAWNLINHLEEELGYPVVERRHGGNSGGKTDLTAEGAVFLRRYIAFEQSVRNFAREEFGKLFEQTEENP